LINLDTAPCGSWLASEKRKNTTFIQPAHVIVDDQRRQVWACRAEGRE